MVGSGTPEPLAPSQAPPPLWAERAATCALAGLSGVGGHALARLRAAYGSLAEAVARGPQELSRTPGLRADAAHSLAAAPDLERRGQWLLESAARLGAAVVVAGERSYPSLLAASPGAPPVLYVLGELRESRRVAVVGTRRADPYGEKLTRRLTECFVASGLEVVSGGAEGVDTVAHRSAIEQGGRTVAVLGTGFLNVFPSQNRRLFEEVARHGAVVSEFALDAGGQRTHFPQRNRTIAGLSEAVVMVRGDQRSGALLTCVAAHRAGRPVFAVPGDADEPLSSGANGMLAEGTARATLDGREVVRALGLAAPDARSGSATRPAAGAAPASSGSLREPAAEAMEGLSPAARRLLAALGPSPRHVDELAATASIGVAEALSELLRLELAGLCVARPGAYFQRR